MNESICLFESFGDIADRYVLEAGERLQLFQTKRRNGRKRLLRTLLIAAIISLMGVTAYATGPLWLTERIFPVEGTERVVVVPNGLKGTKTYEGTVEWFLWVDQHRGETWDTELSFLAGDDAKRKTCQLYGAWSPESADKLYEIAERYGLRLYSESVNAPDRERLFELTGMSPFLTEGEDGIRGGYVFSDGSFHAEGRLALGELRLWYDLNRFSTGALSPFCGVTRLPEYSEREYVNAGGQTVNIVSFPERIELWVLSPDGETFTALCLYSLPEAWELKQAGLADRDALAEYVADRIDFSAVFEKNGAVAEILATPRGAEDNRDAALRLEAFYNSPMFSAAREFQAFFTASFYGASFTGVYGQEGYEDIDAELARLAEKYGLRYAKAKTARNGRTVYDNGVEVWDGEPESRIRKTYFIPKDALYTGMIHYAAPGEYQRIWIYETEEGQQIVCFTDGPEKISGVYLLYETEKSYVLVSLGWNDVAAIEETAERIDWTRFS